PGVGTAIGGAIGTFVGEKLGANLGKSIKDNIPEIKEGASTLWKVAKDNIITGPFAESTELIVTSAAKGIEKFAESTKKRLRNPLKEDNVSAKDGVSKKTAKAVNRYADENIDVTSKLEYFRISGEAYTKEDSEEIIKSYDKMQGIVQDHIDSSRKNSQSDFDKLVASGVMSGDTAKQAAQRAEEDWKFRETKQKEYHDNLVKLEKERADKIEKSNKSHEDKINAIKKKALEENRTLTASENDKIALLEKQ